MIPLVEDHGEMRAQSEVWIGEGLSVGFVPTMGALHEGHLSLVQTARKRCDRVVTSIFVNPLQFGEGEDLSTYPRDPNGDREKLGTAGCDLVFTTTDKKMYPPGFSTYVTNEVLASRFEGEVRPTHFRGVLTVVLKLLHIVTPHIAFFGQKDAQQALLIRRMVRDLDMPVDIEVLPIVREEDGLALSSRNCYLDPDERIQALTLSRALFAAEILCQQGEMNSQRLLAEARSHLERTDGVEVDYLALVNPETLEDIRSDIQEKALLLVAARVGETRLIDNIRLTRKG